ncbi:MAG: hypothetical protein P8J79_12930 [Halioglobus sp.]|nr:hypothetical protein [Halioglobus sp.]
MAQQEVAEDFVIATGQQTSVRDFIIRAANELGITIAFKGQGQLSFKKVSLSKYTTLMGVLWPFGSFITIVNSLNRDKWLSAVDCCTRLVAKVAFIPLILYDHVV